MGQAGALQGVRVLDFSRYMQGPHCSQMLGDLGADIIKVERPGTGDENREIAFNRIHGVNAFFLALNRNKRSFTVNLKHPKGKALIERLLASCDVLLENFRPGTMERLGLGYEAVVPRNPRLIYCSCSGYGPDGPYRDWPGQDLLAQAMGGLAWATGRSGGYPRTAGSYVVDAYGAMLATVGILAALQARGRTGRGQRVDVCLLDAALHMQCQELTYHMNGGAFRARENEEVGHPLEPGPYGIYPAADGQFLAVSSGPWPNLCRALGVPALETDPRFDTPQKRLERRPEVQGELAAIFRQRPRAVWMDRLRAEDVWSAPVNSYADIPGDPQVQWGGMIQTLRYPEVGDYRVIGNPVRLSQTPPSYRTAPPTLGADTDTILGEVGLTAGEIAHLRAEGAI
ncbi:MAG TPA: CoA transferase [Candidatus Methylomirabilis sp.]|nr:CoA transferase [Candidatus Methylomirabilis sp.]